MDNFKEAIPMAYGRGHHNLKVYAAEKTGPPTMVRPSDDTDKNQSIVIELYDFYKEAARQFGKEEVPITRFVLHAGDARQLCVHLIDALARTEGFDSSGIATKLREAMFEIIDETKQREEFNE